VRMALLKGEVKSFVELLVPGKGYERGKKGMLIEKILVVGRTGGRESNNGLGDLRGRWGLPRSGVLKGHVLGGGGGG